jgi:transposase-like protein
MSRPEIGCHTKEGQVTKTYRYSEAFKQQVIMEIESGRFASTNEASEAYGIKGNTTVSNWLRQAGVRPWRDVSHAVPSEASSRASSVVVQ